LNLFATFDTRSGEVYGRTAERKRQVEFIAFLEQLDREIPATVKTIHVVLDDLRMHQGKLVQAWLAKHPRFVFHHPPVHCSWMNQDETALRAVDERLVKFQAERMAEAQAQAERGNGAVSGMAQADHSGQLTPVPVGTGQGAAQRSPA
jgi:DDE superfamily endonuclease